MLTTRLEALNQAIKTNAGEAERALDATCHHHHRVDPRQRARRRAQPHRHLDRREQRAQAERRRGRAHAARRQRRGGAQFRRQGRRDRHGGEPALGRDDQAFSTRSRACCSSRSPAKSQEFSSEVSRVTDHAVKAIEAKGFTFTQTMMDNSEHIARLINEASGIRHRRRRPVAQGTADDPEHRRAGDQRVRRTSAVKDLQRQRRTGDARAPPRPSPARCATCRRPRRRRSSSRSRRRPPPCPRCWKRTACCAPTPRRCSSGCARPTSCCRKCLSGAHENMSEIEQTLVTRVSDFVTTMNDVAAEDRRGEQPGRPAAFRASGRSPRRR